MPKSAKKLCKNCQKECTKLLNSTKIKKMRDDGFKALYGVSILPEQCGGKEACKKKFDNGFKQGIMQKCAENCRLGLCPR